ncbi:cytochrome P450 [Actinokineospora fastidiosa]|uniref:Cytochrome P450 139 n=1 Tax=Actinokineospora fastidiosa TaxID=1816 RepID=A0A918LCG2_9PSEU|nr:cytochrome P450 [Actinokineospora fastidiosa]GGS29379.1 putative cytochrome P450 139 [Actinokineospora fastidiosa]
MNAVLQSLTALARFTTDPYRTMDRLYERNGPVSWVGAGPVRFALLLGPEATEFVIGNSELFSWRRAFAALEPLAGPGALVVNDGPRHRRLRRLVRPAFTADRLAGCADATRRHVAAVIDTWRPGDVVEVYGRLRSALRDATAECLFGPGALRRADGLNAHLQAIHEAIDAGPLVRSLQGRGLPSWRRALAARAVIRQWVAEESVRGRSGPDVLSALLDSRADGGLTQDEVCDQLVSFWAAGAETTAATVAWALHCALSDRAVWDGIVGEASAGDDPPYLDQVVRETLRLYPATAVAQRVAATGFAFAGHRFPAGTTLLFSPYHTHRIKALWTDALRFDPGRWDRARPRRHEYLPFGGGPHRCVGAGLATAMVKAALAEVARSADPWLVSRDATPTGLVGMRPKHGLTLLVRDVVRTGGVAR